ncbi:MAG: septal ring lytic transglycosylase RlpA family lipoprotein [Brevundimonas sp.]|uniref:septal ring lytic transglycosylase RlpA family protein n=1 Tax=Brevundimonas sp. TaxID=1871086 RepID=UPI000DB237B0|nr:septal ring lytic transglycosylase RlpA family protein [Brevundimonas sp.]PZT96089.1 MAG: septal ring lytic transglycosylase RlpA family lipoprotein [Brevundimonas sp.]
MKAGRWMRGAALLGLFSLLAACSSLGGGRGAGGLPVVKDPAPIVSGTMRPYQVRGRWYTPKDQPNYDEVGMASWYGDAFNGRPTSTGERFDMNALTAAHKTLPLPGLVEVTNLSNGRRIVARVNDRGPFVDGRIIDLSREAADELDMRREGVARVRVRYLGQAPRLGGGTVLRAEAPRPAAARPVQVAAVPPAAMQTTPQPYYAPSPLPTYAPSPQVASQAASQIASQAAPPSPAPIGGSYWVQAGAFRDPGAAQRIAERLGARAKVDQTGGGYRVLVGPWIDQAAAESARQAVVARGYAEALLISGG